MASNRALLQDADPAQQFQDRCNEARDDDPGDGGDKERVAHQGSRVRHAFVGSEIAYNLAFGMP